MAVPAHTWAPHPCVVPLGLGKNQPNLDSGGLTLTRPAPAQLFRILRTRSIAFHFRIIRPPVRHTPRNIAPGSPCRFPPLAPLDAVAHIARSLRSAPHSGQPLDTDTVLARRSGPPETLAHHLHLRRPPRHFRECFHASSV